MSIQLITPYFRLHNVKQFRESVSETANSVYYVFAGHSLPYPGGDSVISDLENTTDTIFRDPYMNMVFGKRVSVADVNAVVPRYNWISNTVYTPYRSDVDLSDSQYYVIVDEGTFFRFFKCLDNNANTPSTVSPNFADTAADAEYYATSDGYVWKYMCSVDQTNFSKFATTSWAPVVEDVNVSGNAVSGAIDVISILYRGSNYNSYLSNTFAVDDLRIGGNPVVYNIANNAPATNGFFAGSFLYITGGTGFGQGKRILDYTVIGSSKLVTLESSFDVSLDVSSAYQITPSVLITGDGSGATARAVVNTAGSNSISSVQIINRGSNYTFASAIVVGNTGGVSNAAVLDIVNGPKGGHGADVEYELGAVSVAISVAFANSESNTIPIVNDYRQLGLLKDPLFANVVYSVSSPVGNFTIGEEVTQSSSESVAIVHDWDGISTLYLTNVNGIFITGQTVVGSTSSATANIQSFVINGITKTFSTFDQRSKYTYSPISGSFSTDEVVYQTDMQLANAVFHSNSASYIYLTNIKGILNTGNTIIGSNSGASANLLSAFPGDLVVGSGEVLYLENVNPISRSNTQSETVKFILEF